jgi:hypothetical protein
MRSSRATWTTRAAAAIGRPRRRLDNRDAAPREALGGQPVRGPRTQFRLAAPSSLPAPTLMLSCAGMMAARSVSGTRVKTCISSSPSQRSSREFSRKAFIQSAAKRTYDSACVGRTGRVPARSTRLECRRLLGWSCMRAWRTTRRFDVHRTGSAVGRIERRCRQYRPGKHVSSCAYFLCRRRVTAGRGALQSASACGTCPDDSAGPDSAPFPGLRLSLPSPTSTSIEWRWKKPSLSLECSHL